MTFCTDDFPAVSRTEMWQELIAAKVFGQEVSPVTSAPFFAQANCLRLGKVDLAYGWSSPAVYRRTPRLIAADGNDDLVMVINIAGRLEVTDDSHQSRTLDELSATGFRCGKPVALFSQATAYSDERNHHATSIRIPRQELLRRAPQGERLILGRFDSRGEPFSLLLGYLQLLRSTGTLLQNADLARLAGDHILDMVTLMLNPTRDARREAAHGGLRAGRLAALQRYIALNYRDFEISVGKAASALRISERYVQSLMAETGSSFTETVNWHRLDLVRGLLGDAGNQRQRISDLAFDAGFRDLAYFHRLFRRRFGDSPGAFRIGKDSADEK
ncbi:AraC family transcriptional regulator [Methylococcus mesophilus]|uniref:AraC family transcriptional regulator n=1 Tax=Methylococcus mesophilus TaxID=2993564 RepID=UPI00224B77F9|nr:AraC family transcriptional regulator [Methylococcus mesophilus]UZR27707.1 AraC family transcriptional regulator [Methylococcus mesophilus]